MALPRSISYETYLTHGLKSISKHFDVKEYKKANKDEWICFVPKEDLRIVILWKKTILMEFAVSVEMWRRRNTEPEDKKWMQLFADQKIQLCQDSYNQARNAAIKKKTPPITPPKATTRKRKDSTVITQSLFEDSKKAIGKRKK